MATPQHRINSGFGYRSTAAEVLEGLDLTGRLAIITGGYSGLGLETTRALAGAGAHVVVPARRPEHARRAAYGQAQTANSLFAGAADRRGQAAGVRALAAHPGVIMTPLQRPLPREEMIAS